jgi:alpha-L-rhamnosidase
MDWKANWIWIDEEAQPINSQVCYRKTIHVDGPSVKEAVLFISGDTLFRVSVNGVEIGEGPIRSSTDHWYYEQYDVGHLLKQGENVIAATVWHYGHSNYQYVENRAGFIACLEVSDAHGRKSSYPTDSSWRAQVHHGFEKHVVKRNVNIGWLEVYDARRTDDRWMEPGFDDTSWSSAWPVCAGGEGPWGELFPKEIEPFAKRTIFPRQLVSESEIQPVQKVISVDFRENFFPGQRDANAKIFSGYFACGLEVDEDTTGKLTFAHTPWNGVQGRFKIDGAWHATGDELHLTKGRHLFLVEIGNVHNDVLSHMEWDFPVELRIVHPFKASPEAGESAFVTLGPYQVIETIADGHHAKYGGVEKTNGLDMELPSFREVGTVDSLAAFKQRYQHEAQPVASVYVMENLSIYSLMLRKKMLASFAVKREQERMLYDHQMPTVVPVPSRGGDMEYVIDFGKLYVGRVELELDAPEGTVFDIYGFEAMVKGNIRYTSGLNNAFRYTAREGRQHYKSVSRMGFRYLMITVRNQTKPVSIYYTAVEQSGYPVTDQAVFRCSDPLLNDIWEISRHTSEVCTEDTFVDCPSFERVFWVGDCRVSALVNYYF